MNRYLILFVFFFLSIGSWTQVDRSVNSTIETNIEDTFRLYLLPPQQFETRTIIYPITDPPIIYQPIIYPPEIPPYYWQIPITTNLPVVKHAIQMENFQVELLVKMVFNTVKLNISTKKG